MNMAQEYYNQAKGSRSAVFGLNWQQEAKMIAPMPKSYDEDPGMQAIVGSYSSFYTGHYTGAYTSTSGGYCDSACDAACDAGCHTDV